MAPDDGPPDGPGEHYFSARPKVPHDRRELRFLYRGELLIFEVDAGVFAAHGLDPGTALLIESLDPRPTDRVLDLGCGWGAIGVAAARQARDGSVVLTDVNRRAVALARGNLARNRVSNAEVRAGPLFAPVGDERFDVIATNPPFHAGRETVLRLLSEAPGHLAPGGRLLLVGKGSQGIRYYQAWLEKEFPGPVTVRGRGSGYRVLEARTAPPAAPGPAEAVRSARRPKPLKAGSISAAAPDRGGGPKRPRRSPIARAGRTP
ncbi:MAG TPA: methyltransferase [Thermoplasmata archaeon]|nr:methyltransferase [Thermoplasmata archaeon]